jgi:hypothetical protein
MIPTQEKLLDLFRFQTPILISTIRKECQLSVGSLFVVETMGLNKRLILQPLLLKSGVILTVIFLIALSKLCLILSGITKTLSKQIS